MPAVWVVRVVDLPRVHPFCARSNWHGAIMSLDAAPVDEFGWDDLDRVFAAGEHGDCSDGKVAGVARLKDGRWVAWETFWGPTGDGFSEDAYGGDADIKVAYSPENVIRFGLTDEGRRLCGLPALTS